MLTPPDLSARPLGLAVERNIQASPKKLFRAWTGEFDQWFAANGTLKLKPEVDALLFFETHFDGQRHPHYGRVLEVVPDELLKITWVTGNPGTRGAETVVTVKLTSRGEGTRVRLTHEGFADEESKDGHAKAWPLVLSLLDEFATKST